MIKLLLKRPTLVCCLNPIMLIKWCHMYEKGDVGQKKKKSGWDSGLNNKKRGGGHKTQTRRWRSNKNLNLVEKLKPEWKSPRCPADRTGVNSSSKFILCQSFLNLFLESIDGVFQLTFIVDSMWYNHFLLILHEKDIRFHICIFQWTQRKGK